MEYLSKQQLLLLALLVSFVTSMATGIVTVSLMDQNPSVGRTITQVIEKTIDRAVSDDAAVANVQLSVEDRLASATDLVSQSVVVLRDASGNTLPALGLIVSNKGVIITDKNVIAGRTGLQIVLGDKTHVLVAVIQSQVAGDIAFLAPITNPTPVPKFQPVVLASARSLGQSVYTLSGTSSLELGQGLVTSLGEASSSPINGSVTTSIIPAKVSIGSPLYNIDGVVIGIHTSSLQTSTNVGESMFYAVKQLQSAIPVIR